MSIAELLQVVEVREVALVGDALPDAAGGVALCQGHAVDAQEDVGGIHQSFHEGDAQLVDKLIVPIVVFVARNDKLWVSCIFFGLPVLGDGGHHQGRVAIVVPMLVAVFGCPDAHPFMMWNRSSPKGVGGDDAKKFQVLMRGAEALPHLQDVGILRLGRATKDDETRDNCHNDGQ